MRLVPPCGFSRYGGDQSTNLGVQARASQSSARPPVPEEEPALTVPSQHGLRLDYEQVASPVPMEAADDQPEELVTAPDAVPVWQRSATWSCWRRSKFSRKSRWRLRRTLARAAKRSAGSSIIGGGPPIVTIPRGLVQNSAALDQRLRPLPNLDLPERHDGRAARGGSA